MSGSKCVRKVTITNPQGMHARPADMFVKLANRFTSDIVIIKGSERVDGKSILGLLTLAATEGTELCLEADGPDAEAALAALAELVAQNFAEDEPPRQ
ncbi:MAG TPA: HPr family phosphocarrier protein [Pirellulales bacterium]